MVLFALACLDAHAAPRPKRTGPFAEFIDPKAPVDPPRAPEPERGYLDVVFLVDLAADDDKRFEARKEAVHTLIETLDDWDATALLTIDSFAHTVLRAEAATSTRKRLRTALPKLVRTETSALAEGLEAARDYLTKAPERRAILVFTDSMPDPWRRLILEARKVDILVVFVTPTGGGYHLDAVTFALEGHRWHSRGRN